MSCLSIDRKNCISTSKVVLCSYLGLNPVCAGWKWVPRLGYIVGLRLLCELA